MNQTNCLCLTMFKLPCEQLNWEITPVFIHNLLKCKNCFLYSTFISSYDLICRNHCYRFGQRIHMICTRIHRMIIRISIDMNSLFDKSFFSFCSSFIFVVQGDLMCWYILTSVFPKNIRKNRWWYYLLRKFLLHDIQSKKNIFH